MKREIIKDRRLTNSEVSASFGKSSYALRKTLKEIGCERKVAKKKPFISKMNKRKRCYVWRRTDESWMSECLQATMKHGGLGIMFWKFLK